MRCFWAQKARLFGTLPGPGRPVPLIGENRREIASSGRKVKDFPATTELFHIIVLIRPQALTPAHPVPGCQVAGELA
jgi:hypothetical protein